MQKIPRPLIVLHDSREVQEALREVADSHRLQLQTHGGWASLAEAVRNAPASALLVVDPFFGSANNDRIADELGALLAAFPSITAIAAFEVGSDLGETIVRLGELGVVEVVDTAEESSATALAHRILAARGRPLRLLVERALPDRTSASARAILSAAASIVSEGGQGQDLADELRITPRTLSRWCRRAGLPPPKRLLAWMRILQAAEFLDDPDRPVSAVAAACGYAADSSLRLALRRFTGLTPTEMREQGAFAAASGGFLEALDEARAPKKRYRAESRPKS